MGKFSFYEQVGIVIPGSVFLFGALFYFPELRSFFAKDGINLGGLGLFMLLAYATGHLLGAVGNIVESIYWKTRGGMPTNWIIGPKPRLLSSPQIARVEALIKARLGIDISPLATLVISEWYPVSRQLYSDVDRHGKPNRIDTFNGNYGLSRGLSAAMFSLAAMSMILDRNHLLITLSLVLAGAVYLYRMHRFGVHYARELYNQFLLLPSDPTANTPPRRRRQT